MVTIAVDQEVWRFLQVRKTPGDSFNDVLRRELDLDDSGDDSDDGPKLEDTPTRDVPASVAAAIDAWEPPEDIEVNTEHARVALRQGVAWLRTQDGPRRKGQIQDGAHTEGRLSRRIWWENAVRPGFQALDAVEDTNKQYRWVGAKNS